MSDERYTKALEAHIDVLRSKINALETECAEQARLNGIGASRELALQARVNALTAENAEMKRDAERYQYLKRNGDASNGQPFIARYNGSFSRWIGAEADDVIDAALKAKQ